jgi:predicted HAD superfamily phosphohydrolase
MSETLFTDGEGPLVFKDLASDITGRVQFKSGDQEVPGSEFFGALSLYDDYCAEVGMEGYQAGDTLALVVPHLLHHDVLDKDVDEEAADTEVINGVEEYVDGLIHDGWNLRVISTAYRPMWNLVGDRLGIPSTHIACTELNLWDLNQTHLQPKINEVVEAAEQKVLPLLPLVSEAQDQIDTGVPVTEALADDRPCGELRSALDDLYWRDLPELGYNTLQAVRVIGGRRKVEAAKRFAKRLQVPMDEVAYTGDSITDDQMHKHLLDSGGMPIAVNGNRYALRNAFAGVATTDMRSVRPLLDAWSKGGRDGVAEFVESSQSDDSEDPVAKYHLIYRADQETFDAALTDHKTARVAVRGLGTAALG